mmetsp:Transcript_131944/g.422187  ORF Transcript_131944/g.422187 Transcript_131944/m.422187 type:complete len:99 (+) Transcript_131944:326-622(+)
MASQMRAKPRRKMLSQQASFMATMTYNTFCTSSLIALLLITADHLVATVEDEGHSTHGLLAQWPGGRGQLEAREHGGPQRPMHPVFRGRSLLAALGRR